MAAIAKIPTLVSLRNFMVPVFRCLFIAAKNKQ